MGGESKYPPGTSGILSRHQKKVLAFAGRNGSGKETVAKKMAKALGGAETHTYSDILRETFQLWGYTENSRHDMQELSTFMRTLKGQDALAKVIVKKCREAKTPWVVIDGVRRVEDLDALIEEFGRACVILVWVETSADLRYERLKARKEKAGEAFMDRAQFDREELAESERMLHDVYLARTREIDNNGTLETLAEQLGILYHDLIVAPFWSDITS